MPKCPKCNREIKELGAIAKELNLYYYNPEGDREFSENIDYDLQYYKCPHCYTRLDIDDIEAFWSGKEKARERSE